MSNSFLLTQSPCITLRWKQEENICFTSLRLRLQALLTSSDLHICLCFILSYLFKVYLFIQVTDQ